MFPLETLLVVATGVLIAGAATLTTLVDRAQAAWLEVGTYRATLRHYLKTYPGSPLVAAAANAVVRARRAALVATAWPTAVALVLVAVLVALVTVGWPS